MPVEASDLSKGQRRNGPEIHTEARSLQVGECWTNKSAVVYRKTRLRPQRRKFRWNGRDQAH